MSEARTVAVIGASSDRRKFGNKAVRCYAAAGLKVYPVNPNEQTVEGLTAYPDIASVPAPVEVVSFYVPPKVVASVLPAVAQRKPREIWFNPGTANGDVANLVLELDLPAVYGCSIVMLGHSPSEFPDA
jgi:predicted CoA-binding protein